MFVVKVGEYYVKKFTVDTLDICILLSKEVMRGFNKLEAQRIAKATNGEVIEITEEVVNE